jgi:carbamate kinase
VRILVALDSNVLLQRRDLEVAGEALAEIGADHQLVVVHSSGPEVSSRLELGLRNALPDRDLVTVVPQVVVSGDSPSPEPSAIAQLRSLRLLVDAGVVVICSSDGVVPIAVDRAGALRGIEAMVDGDLSASLLARRLDADMLVLLTDGGAPAEAQEEAARRFIGATGRPAAIGSLTEAVEIVTLALDEQRGDLDHPRRRPRGRPWSAQGAARGPA